MSVALDLARKHHQAGRMAEAEALYRILLRNRPSDAAVHHDLGVLLHQSGRMADAAHHYSLALRTDPGRLDTRINLAHARIGEGRTAEALADFEALHAEAPANEEVLEGLGLLLLHHGRQAEAVTVHQALLAIRPGDLAARARLAGAMTASTRAREAVAIYRELRQSLPDSTDVMINLANALDADHQYDEAVTLYKEALARAPKQAEAHYNLGNCWLHQEKLEDAIACYRRAIALKPDYLVAEENLGLALCRLGALDEAMRVFAGLGPRHVPQGSSAHKDRHDGEQRAYLLGAPPLDGSRVMGPAVNPANARSAQEEWRHRNPKIVVIDDLLTPDALEKLRRYLWAAPVWQRAYNNGYLGAMPAHGLAAPLLAQIAGELAATFPAIFAGHPLRYFWAFKYDSQMRGIAIHADQAAVNVNFWLTPDSANRDPQSGGLKVWDVAAPADWDFDTYNSDGTAIRDFLARENAKAVTIPYRANRAVIFDSDLFHETDVIDFEDGYLNRRINMTMLYGNRTAADR